MANQTFDHPRAIEADHHMLPTWSNLKSMWSRFAEIPLGNSFVPSTLFNISCCNRGKKKGKGGLKIIMVKYFKKKQQHSSKVQEQRGLGI